MTIRASKSIYRLLDVTHHIDIVFGNLRYNGFLHIIRILIFVDHNIVECIRDFFFDLVVFKKF